MTSRNAPTTYAELIEGLAAAIYHGRNGANAVPFSRRDGAHKGPYQQDAKVAIDHLRQVWMLGSVFYDQIYEDMKRTKG